MEPFAIPRLSESLERRASRLAERIRNRLGADFVAISVQADRKLQSIGLANFEDFQPLPTEHHWADTICAKVLERGGVLVTEDARQDPELRDLSHVKDAGFVGYVGYPIRDSDGHCYGVFCAISTTPRKWSEQDMTSVAMAACEAGSLFAVHQIKNELAGFQRTLADADRTLMALANSMTMLVSVHDETGNVLFASSSLRSVMNDDALEAAVRPVLTTDPFSETAIQTQVESTEPVVRVDNLVSTSLTGARVPLSAHIRESTADTYYVYWKIGASKLLN